MTIHSALEEAFFQYNPADHLMIQAGSDTLVWYDGEWHIRPVHGLVGPAVSKNLVLQQLKIEGGYIVIEEPPVRERDRPKPEAWRQVYLVRVEPDGEVYEMELE